MSGSRTPSSATTGKPRIEPGTLQFPKAAAPQLEPLPHPQLYNNIGQIKTRDRYSKNVKFVGLGFDPLSLKSHSINSKVCELYI